MGNAKRKKAVAAKVAPIKPFEAPPKPPTIEEIAEVFDALNDFVIVQPIEMKASEILEESAHWKQSPNWATVIAIGDAAGRVVNGVLVPLKAQIGDVVYITRYGEDINLDGLKCQLVHGTEVKVRRKKK